MNKLSLIVPMTFLSFLLSCENETTPSVEKNTQNINTAVSNNQAPVIKLSLSKGDHVEADVGMTGTAGVTIFNLGDVISFDYSASFDDRTDKDSLEFFTQITNVSIPQNAPIESTSTSFDVTFTSPGSYRVDANVIDQDGSRSTKTFNISVNCAKGGGFSLNENALTISMGADANGSLYQYVPQNSLLKDVNINGDTTKNINDFLIRYDFNGDDLYDSPWLSTKSVEVPNIYVSTPNNFNSNGLPRTVKYEVRHKICSLISRESSTNHIFAGDANFDSSGTEFINIGSSISPFMGSRAFIQGEAKHSPDTNPSVMTKTLVVEPTNPSKRLVSCDYSRKNGKGTFKLTGLANFKNLGIPEKKSHGIEVVFNNIDDTFAYSVNSSNGDNTVIPGTVSTANAKLISLGYRTDEEPDKNDGLAKTYVADINATVNGIPNCQFEIEVRAVPAMGTCTTNPSQDIFTEISIAASCQSLKFGNDEISLNKVLGYCTHLAVKPCGVGGGGGGGPDDAQ